MSLGGGPAVAQEDLSAADWFLTGIVGKLDLIWLGHFPCSGDVTSLKAMVDPALIKEGAPPDSGRWANGARPWSWSHGAPEGVTLN